MPVFGDCKSATCCAWPGLPLLAPLEFVWLPVQSPQSCLMSACGQSDLQSKKVEQSQFTVNSEECVVEPSGSVHCQMMARPTHASRGAKSPVESTNGLTTNQFTSAPDFGGKLLNHLCTVGEHVPTCEGACKLARHCQHEASQSPSPPAKMQPANSKLSCKSTFKCLSVNPLLTCLAHVASLILSASHASSCHLS